MDFGGDGIYAAWTLVNEEPPFKEAMNKGLYSGRLKISNSYGWGKTPKAKKLQKDHAVHNKPKKFKREKHSTKCTKSYINFF